MYLSSIGDIALANRGKAADMIASAIVFALFVAFTEAEYDDRK